MCNKSKLLRFISTDQITRFPARVSFLHFRSLSLSLPIMRETEKLAWHLGKQRVSRKASVWCHGTWHSRACCSIRWATTGEAEWCVYRHRGIFRASSRRGAWKSRHSDLLRRRLGRGAHINGTTLTRCRPVLRVRCSHVLSTWCRSIFVPFLFSHSSLETRKRSRFLPRTSHRRRNSRNNEHQRSCQDLRAEAFARRNDRAKIMDHRHQVFKVRRDQNY